VAGLDAITANPRSATRCVPGHDPEQWKGGRLSWCIGAQQTQRHPQRPAPAIGGACPAPADRVWAQVNIRAPGCGHPSDNPGLRRDGFGSNQRASRRYF
jgi:hypothetical protein